MDDILNRIKSPKDLEKLTNEEQEKLCNQIRYKLIGVVSKTGGHLASNLGVVELTVALHKAFNNPEDKIVWDVGHQCYTHKMITGRLNKIDTIRQEDGLSGFPKRSESKYDAFNAGHSSTSISAAFGILKAKEIKGESGHVVAVIGDGSLTGGLAYEGLNNAGRSKRNFIVVLNDNKMSISQNVGSIARYLASMRTKPVYLKMRDNLDVIVENTPIFGKSLSKIVSKSKKTLKSALYDSTLFQDMGFSYYGPFDGHDINNLVNSFNVAKQINGPVLIHVVTKKGKGYKFAEKDPKNFHGISGFDIKTGESLLSKTDFSEEFGSSLCNFAEKDNRICAITAAMKSATGLAEFEKKYKDRFFDVGIAEEHAVTFASGLSAGGLIPVFAVYSTFLQRAYDQIIHDAAMQNLKVILGIDRAGIVGEDGETHQGVFDVPFLNSIPNVTILSPTYYSEVSNMLYDALYKYDGVVAIRYPRGTELYRPNDFINYGKSFDVYCDKKTDIAIVTYGRLFSYACRAKEKLQNMGINVSVIKLNRIKPVSRKAIELINRYTRVFFFEESMKCGSVGERIRTKLSDLKFEGDYFISAIEDRYVHHASVFSTLKHLGLDDDGMVNTICAEVNMIERKKEA